MQPCCCCERKKRKPRQQQAVPGHQRVQQAQARAVQSPQGAAGLVAALRRNAMGRALIALLCSSYRATARTPAKSMPFNRHRPVSIVRLQIPKPWLRPGAPITVTGFHQILIRIGSCSGKKGATHVRCGRAGRPRTPISLRVQYAGG